MQRANPQRANEGVGSWKTAQACITCRTTLPKAPSTCDSAIIMMIIAIAFGFRPEYHRHIPTSRHLNLIQLIPMQTFGRFFGWSHSDHGAKKEREGGLCEAGHINAHLFLWRSTWCQIIQCPEHFHASFFFGGKPLIWFCLKFGIYHMSLLFIIIIIIIIIAFLLLVLLLLLLLLLSFIKCNTYIYICIYDLLERQASQTTH